MNDLLSRALRKLRGGAAEPSFDEEFARVAKSSSPWSAAVVAVVNDVRENRLSTEETEWIARIEALRSQLARQSDRQVTFTDYGAGDPGKEYGADDMANGVVVTRNVADISAKGGLKYSWLLLLFKFVRAFKPSSCVELGTSLGMSAAYQAAALAINGKGRLITLDGAAALAQIATENWESLGLAKHVHAKPGRFQDTLGEVLRESTPVDYAFIDGHHDEQATVAYFEQFLPCLAPDAVLIFDDIMWYEGMKRAWHRIESHPSVKLAVDLGVVGVVVVSNRAIPKEYYTARL